MAKSNEIGYQVASLPTWGQLANDEEPNPDLVWPKSISVFDRMRVEDSQVGSVMRAVTLPIRSAIWVVDPAGADPEVVDLIADDLNLQVKGRAYEAPLRTKGRFSWEEHLRLALLELIFGHSFFEQVYDIQDDGRAHLRKLAWRPPKTISEIDVASDGGLKSIKQFGIAGKPSPTIPVDRIVAYVNDREGGSWQGRSVLRAAYKDWLLKDRIIRAQAIVVERNSLGIPTYENAPPPEGLKGEELKKWLADENQAGLKITQNLRAGKSAGVSYPSGGKLSLMGVTGKLPDTEKPIRYHDEQIARAVLAHFLNLGTETGSWALGSTFANFFTDSLNAVAQHIADVTQQHVIEDLVDLNWGPDIRAPRLTFEPIGSEHPATADAIKMLIDCLAITPDDALEAHMRDRYGLPVKDEATSREAPAPNPPSGDVGGEEP